MTKKPIKQGEYIGGIWFTAAEIEKGEHIIKKTQYKLRKNPTKTTKLTKNNPTGINKHTKIPVVMPKPLTDLQKYHKICKLNEDILKIKTEGQEYRKKYLSLAQKMGILQQKQQEYME